MNPQKKVGRIKKIRNVWPFVKGTLRQEAKIKTRDLYRKITKRYPKIKAVVVDIDGTLVRGKIYDYIAEDYPALKNAEGYPSLKNFQDVVLKNMREKKISFDSGFKQIIDEYIRIGVRTESVENAVKRAVKEGLMNTELISAMRYLQKQNIKVIAATRTSKYVADIIKNMYGFDGAIGSEEITSNGKIVGIRNLIGIKKEKIDGIQVLTKAQYIKEHPKQFNFKSKNTAFVAEEFSDVAVDNSGYEFHFNPKNPIEPKLTSYSNKLRLYDKKIDEKDPHLREKFIAYITNPKTQYSKKLLEQELRKIPKRELYKGKYKSRIPIASRIIWKKIIKKD